MPQNGKKGQTDCEEIIFNPRNGRGK